MEWEPLLDEQNFFASAANSIQQAITDQSSAESTAFEEAAGSAELALKGTFYEYDVLMNGPDLSSNLFKTGVCFYQDQIGSLRPMFRQSQTRADQQRVVQTLLETVWAQGGRFLVLDKKTGAISMPSNATAAAMVRGDLSGKKRNVLEHTKKKTKKRATAAPLRKKNADNMASFSAAAVSDAPKKMPKSAKKRHSLKPKKNTRSKPRGGS